MGLIYLQGNRESLIMIKRKVRELLIRHQGEEDQPGINYYLL